MNKGFNPEGYIQGKLPLRITHEDGEQYDQLAMNLPETAQNTVGKIPAHLLIDALAEDHIDEEIPINEISRSYFFLTLSELIHEQENTILMLDDMLDRITQLRENGLTISFFADKLGNLAYTYKEKKGIGFNLNQGEDSENAENDPTDLLPVSEAQFILIHEKVRTYARDIAQMYNNMLDQVSHYEGLGLFNIFYYISDDGILSYEVETKDEMGFKV